MNHCIFATKQPGLEAGMTAWEWEIDGLVYGLNGLTREEIALAMKAAGNEDIDRYSRAPRAADR